MDLDETLGSVGELGADSAESDPQFKEFQKHLDSLGDADVERIMEMFANGDDSEMDALFKDFANRDESQKESTDKAPIEEAQHEVDPIDEEDVVGGQANDEKQHGEDDPEVEQTPEVRVLVDLISEPNAQRLLMVAEEHRIFRQKLGDLMERFQEPGELQKWATVVAAVKERAAAEDLDDVLSTKLSEILDGITDDQLMQILSDIAIRPAVVEFQANDDGLAALENLDLEYLVELLTQFSPVNEVAAAEETETVEAEDTVETVKSEL